MDPLTISAAAGLRARMDSLEMLANNIANGSAGGYKADREFYSLYAAAEASQPAPDTLPVIERPWVDFSQAQLRPTGSPLDFALAGKGFFGVNGPHGTLYTRDGNFRVSRDGVLVTAQGYPVRGLRGVALAVSPGQPVDVGPDGVVRQAGQEVGRLEVVDFSDLSALGKQGHSYFKLTGTGSKPFEASGTSVEQGQLENSNVSPAEAAVRLIDVMRQFEMLQKTIGIGAEMNRKAIEEVARV